MKKKKSKKQKPRKVAPHGTAKPDPKASPFNGVVPPAHARWKPGQSGNPKGRKTAGATIREHINSMAQAELTEKQLRDIARDARHPWPRRSAAERILRTLEAGDLSDFAGLLRGENSLEDLRGMGINTEVVKKFKQKTRKQLVGEGEEAHVEEIIEREIELHDRAGADFDRIVEHTDGRPKQTAEVTGDVILRTPNDRSTAAGAIAARLRQILKPGKG